jgi:hypothetical protein
MIKVLIEKLKKLSIYNVSDNCECGQHNKCVRKIHSNAEGKLWIQNEDHFKCGKVKKQVNDMLEWWNNYR